MSPTRSSAGRIGSSRPSLLVLDDRDLLSPIISGCPLIQENKENIDMSTHELQLLEAFCQGRDRLDAAMPAVKQDILSSLCTEGLQADQVAENEGGPQQPGSARTPVIRRPPCQSHSPLPQGFPRRPLQDITDAITNPRADEAQGKGKRSKQGLGLHAPPTTVWADPTHVDDGCPAVMGHAARPARSTRPADFPSKHLASGTQCSTGGPKLLRFR